MSTLSETDLTLGLIAANSEYEAIPVLAIYSVKLDMKKFEVMVKNLRNYVHESKNPKTFWDGLLDHLSSQHLNDVEAFIYGTMVMGMLMKLGGSVIWGRKAAEKNNIDYDEFEKEMEEHDLESGLEDQGHSTGPV